MVLKIQVEHMIILRDKKKHHIKPTERQVYEDLKSYALLTRFRDHSTFRETISISEKDN